MQSFFLISVAKPEARTVCDDLNVSLSFFLLPSLHRDPAEGPDLQEPDSEAAAGDAQAGAPGQRAQVHGHLPETAHLLLSLQGVHLVRAAQTPWHRAAQSFVLWGQGTPSPECHLGL